MSTRLRSLSGVLSMVNITLLYICPMHSTISLNIMCYSDGQRLTNHIHMHILNALPHDENLSGTDQQYIPYSTTRPKIEAWKPPPAKP